MAYLLRIASTLVFIQYLLLSFPCSIWLITQSITHCSCAWHYISPITENEALSLMYVQW